MLLAVAFTCMQPICSSSPASFLLLNLLHFLTSVSGGLKMLTDGYQSRNGRWMATGSN